VRFLTAIVPGKVATITVDMTASPMPCALNAWLDFNGNRSWGDADEQIFTDQLLASGALHTLPFDVPGVPMASTRVTSVSKIGVTFARFRCSTLGGLAPGGAAPDGEVEDYRVELLAQPRPPVLTASIVNITTLRLGWPKVTHDVYGNARLAGGYRVYRDFTPYFGPVLPAWAELWESGVPLPNPVTQNAVDLGDPSVHHFYIVRAVYRDIYMNELDSDDSNREGEFEFSLVPGTP
jgi:hypothetical protein